MIGNSTVTKYGEIQGVCEDGCIVFKGVPYAKPPVGDLRWRAPQKPEPWDGVYMADTWPDRCVQSSGENRDGPSIYDKEFHSYNEPDTPVSEDSLYLNIWVPEGHEGEKLPVAMFIHGGAFTGGTGHEVEFRSSAYAGRGVILVTVNYRLGILGFLAHPWLSEEDAAACGNYGILDQIAALDWLGENIAAFGGDPDNITVFGQSAGCMSVQTLLSVEPARGRFARAILQSGAGYPVIIQPDLPLELACECGEKAAQSAGASSLEELRSVPAETLLGIQERITAAMFMDWGGMIFAPVRNGALRSRTYDEIAAAGETFDVPTMIGSTGNDITLTPEEAASGDSRFQRYCVAWALLMEQVGHAPSYVYHFIRELPGDDAGAFHASELWYMLGTYERCWRPMTEADAELSARMVAYWTNFMKNGDPNGEGLPPWPPCTARDPFEMQLDAE